MTQIVNGQQNGFIFVALLPMFLTQDRGIEKGTKIHVQGTKWKTLDHMLQQEQSHCQILTRRK